MAFLKCNICSCEFSKRPANFKKNAIAGNPCPKCSIRKRGKETRKYSYGDIKKIVKNRGYELLTSKEEFDSHYFSLSKVKLELKCPNNHTCKIDFNNFHNSQTDCSICKKELSIHFREKHCRIIFEDISGKKFPEYIIPKDDSNLINIIQKYGLELKKNSLSLDGFCNEHRIAFEHHGAQHYRFVEYFHKSRENFEKQKIRDEIKKEWCKLNKIKLVEISYKIKESDLPQKISQELLKNKLSITGIREFNYYKVKLL